MNYHIERWYDRDIRSWVAALKDEEHNQVAASIVLATRAEIKQVKQSDFTDYYGNYQPLVEGRYLLEASGLTFQELAANSSKVLAASDYKTSPSNFRFENIKMNEFPGMKFVSYDTLTFSKDSSKHYNTSIFFYNVDIKNGEKPDLNKSVVRVSCSCPAYYFYASYWNKVGGVHARRPLRPYTRKTDDLPERNPMHIPCACKHILAFGDFLSNENYQYPATVPAKLQKPFSTDDKEKRFGFDMAKFKQSLTNMPKSKLSTPIDTEEV